MNNCSRKKNLPTKILLLRNFYGYKDWKSVIDMFRYGTRKAARLINNLKYRYFPGLLPESVYFYTFHKCASAMFARHILGKLKGYRLVNYGHLIYSGALDSKDKIIHKQRGYCYGPIRLSQEENTPAYDLLIEEVSSPDFIRDKKAVFLIRDPRDILISAYYSFGFTHNFSAVEKIRKRQELQRDYIQKLTLDEYVLNEAEKQIQYFDRLDRLAKAGGNSVVIKYEDMIENFDYFISRLRKVIPVHDKLADEIYMRSRPQETEDKTRHKRSGKVGDFRNKLKEETVVKLNRKLESTLILFQYEI